MRAFVCWEGDGDLCMYSDMDSLLMQLMLGYDALIWREDRRDGFRDWI